MMVLVTASNKFIRYPHPCWSDASGQQVQWDLLWPRGERVLCFVFFDACFFGKWWSWFEAMHSWRFQKKVSPWFQHGFTQAHVRRPSPSPREAEDLRPPRPSRLVSLSPQAAVALVVGTPTEGVVALCWCIVCSDSDYVCICLFN